MGEEATAVDSDTEDGLEDMPEDVEDMLDMIADGEDDEIPIIADEHIPSASGEPDAKKARKDAEEIPGLDEQYTPEKWDNVMVSIGKPPFARNAGLDPGLHYPFKMMIIDAECVTARRNAEYDDSGYNLTRDRLPEERKEEEDETAEEEPEWRKAWREKNGHKRSYEEREPTHMVTVIKLYGIMEDGRSVCVTVHGYYPRLNVKLTAGMTNDKSSDLIAAMCEEMEDILHKSKLQSQARFRNSKQGAEQPPKVRKDLTQCIVNAKVINAFPACPYVPEPVPFLELRMSQSGYVKTLAEKLLGDPPHYGELPRPLTVCGRVLEPYSADDALTQYLVEHKITGFSWVEVSQGGISVDDLDNRCTFAVDAPCKQVKRIEMGDSLLPMRIMALDIECIKTAGMPDFHEQAVIVIGMVLVTAEHGLIDLAKTTKIILQWDPTGTATRQESMDVHISFHSEEAMLEAFGALLTAYDPDMFLGHNIIGFDLPYLVQRANHIGVPSVANMGRSRPWKWTPPREIRKEKKGGSVRINLRADTPGVVQLDTLPLMIINGPESSYKLGNLSAKWLDGDTKDEVGYQMIVPLWMQNPDTRSRVGIYCFKDAMLALRLAALPAIQMLATIIQLTMATNSTANKYMRSGQYDHVRMQMLDRATKPEFDTLETPAFYKYERIVKQDKKDKYKGAVVVDPIRGYSARPVGVCDFKSLYPSIMVSNNICTSTALPGQLSDQLGMVGAQEGGKASAHDQSATDFYTAPFVGHKYVNQKYRTGILPYIVSARLADRERAKAAMKNAKTPQEKAMLNFRQLALKIIANSVYGVQALIYRANAEAVTGWGRAMISKTRALAIKRGHKVLYGDTDSVMVLFKDCNTVEETQAAMKDFCKEASAMFMNPVELQAEKVYMPYLNLGKKRYVGVCYITGAKPKLDSKGVEKNRLDNCGLARKTMEDVFKLLMAPDKPKLDEALHYVHEVCRKLYAGEIPMTDLMISKSISKEKYATDPAHLVLARRMQKIDPSYPVAPGERIPYVVVVPPSTAKYSKSTKKFSLSSIIEDPLRAIQTHQNINIQYYIENQIATPLSRIFMWLVLGEDDLKPIHYHEQMAIDAFERGAPDSEQQAITKTVHKYVKIAADKAMNCMVGNSVLCDIPRIVKSNGPISKFFTVKTLRQKLAPAEYEKRLAAANEELAKAKTKCNTCRGYVDDNVQCVQRDCKYLFILAKCSQDVEDLMA